MVKLNKESFEMAMKECDNFSNFINYGTNCLCGVFTIQLSPTRMIEIQSTCNHNLVPPFELSKKAWLFIDDYNDEWGCSQQIEENQADQLRSKINKTILRGLEQVLYRHLEDEAL